VRGLSDWARAFAAPSPGGGRLLHLQNPRKRVPPQAGAFRCAGEMPGCLVYFSCGSSEVQVAGETDASDTPRALHGLAKRTMYWKLEWHKSLWSPTTKNYKIPPARDAPLWYCVVLCGTVWYCVVLCGTVWYCVVLSDPDNKDETQPRCNSCSARIQATTLKVAIAAGQNMCG
jgi:hypothetical protein